MKLDYIAKLEDMLVPHLIKKNISLVVTFGNKFLAMIDGMVALAEKNLNFDNDHGTQASLAAFKGWMKRFIVTNYEIFLDHFKFHSDFVAQKYFNRDLITSTTSYLIKNNT